MFSKTNIDAGIVPKIIHDSLVTTTIHLVFFMSCAHVAYILLAAGGQWTVGHRQEDGRVHRRHGVDEDRAG